MKPYLLSHRKYLVWWVGGWMDGWVVGKTGLRIAYSNQKLKTVIKKRNKQTKTDGNRTK